MDTLSFTKEEYSRIIDYGMVNNYVFTSFRDFKKIKREQKKVIILRHDVDLSLELALEMAELESGLGIKSTYFILLFNDFYNPFSYKGKSMIKRISDLGHEIGLHWDSKDHVGNLQCFDDEFQRHVSLLESITNDRIVSVSQHDPTNNPNLHIPPQFNNAYDKKFFNNDDFLYVSDSSMKWRKYTPIDIINQGKSFQFLSHSIWWFAKGGTIEEKMKDLIKINNESFKRTSKEFTDLINNMLKDREKQDNNYLRNIMK